LYFGNCLPLLVVLQRLQGELYPMEFAIVEHCATKVNSLNISPGGDPFSHAHLPQLSIEEKSRKSFFLFWDEGKSVPSN